MADQKISELVAKTTIADTDLFAMVDEEATPDETKKITGANVKAQVLAGHKDLTTGVHGFNKSARVYPSANQSIPNAVFTALNFDSEDWDTDTIHDTVTNNDRLTCKTAGKYLASAVVRWDDIAGGARNASILFNGSAIFGNWVSLDPNNRASHAIALLLNMAVNDYVLVNVYQSSGAAMNILASETKFGIARIA